MSLMQLQKSVLSQMSICLIRENTMYDSLLHVGTGCLLRIALS